MRYTLLLLLTLLSFNVLSEVVINHDATPNVLYECDIPTTLGDVASTPMSVADIARIDFEVSNDNQATWQPAGSSIASQGIRAKCSQSYSLASSPDDTYFYRSFYTHVKGKISGYTAVLEVKLERPLILLPMANPRMTATQSQ